jgi:uncharacterized protein
MMFRSLLAVSAIALAAATFSPAFAEDQKLPRTIALTGHGEARVAPDLVVVTIGVSSTAATAAEALRANSANMTAVFATLKDGGIADKDVQTANFTVQPRYDYSDNSQPPKLAGYDVSNMVTVTVRKIDSLGTLLDKVVTAGSNQINGIAFQVSEPQAALDEARQEAVRDAARKAGVYTTAANVKLGPVISISEGPGYQPPVPVQVKMVRAEADGAPPVAQGEATLSVDVNIVWEIN